MPDDTSNICVLGATFDTENMGVSALAAGTIKCILHRWPQANVFLLNYGNTGCIYDLRFGERKVSVHLVNMRFSKKFYLQNNVAFLILVALILKLIPFQRLRNKIIAANRCLTHLKEADIVASIAGGDSFSDIYGLGRLLYVSLPQVLALFLGKKLVLLPQTLGPFKGRIASAIGKYIMNRAELIYSRDYTGLRETQNWLAPNGNSAKVRFCYDVGFVVDPIPPAHLDLVGLSPQRRENRDLVGLNISGLLFMGGYNHDNMFGLKVEYDKLVHSLIDTLINGKKTAVMLIPHVFGNHEESDALVCENVYEAVKAKYGESIGLVRGTYDQSEIKYIIGLCDFFVGSRMHACIAALSQNVPAVAVAYSDKFVGVLETIGVDSLVVDPRKMDMQELIGLVGQAYDQRSLVRKHLETRIPQVRERLLGLFADLKDLCSVAQSE